MRSDCAHRIEKRIVTLVCSSRTKTPPQPRGFLVAFSVINAAEYPSAPLRVRTHMFRSLSGLVLSGVEAAEANLLVFNQSLLRSTTLTCDHYFGELLRAWIIGRI